jgi:hypothetical protein
MDQTRLGARYALVFVDLAWHGLSAVAVQRTGACGRLNAVDQGARKGV